MTTQNILSGPTSLLDAPGLLASMVAGIVTALLAKSVLVGTVPGV